MAPSVGRMHIVVSGSSGLIGTALVKRLSSRGHQVTRLVRRTPRPGEVHWNPDSGTIEAGALKAVDAFVNLAGAGVADHRWTDEYKRTLVDSRLRTTELLATTIAALEPRPTVLVNGSAIGFYGARGDEELDESDRGGTGFLADLVRRWEAATSAASDAGVRVAHIRTGIVLSRHGGALKQLLPIYKLGLGGRIGSGDQWQSWITIDDEVAAIEHLLASDLSGAVNLTAPNPVRQKDFARALGRALHRPAFWPIPAFGPKLLFGRELGENLAVTGQRVVPKRLLADGYVFEHPELDGALAHVLRS